MKISICVSFLFLSLNIKSYGQIDSLKYFLRTEEIKSPYVVTFENIKNYPFYIFTQTGSYDFNNNFTNLEGITSFLKENERIDTIFNTSNVRKVISAVDFYEKSTVLTIYFDNKGNYLLNEYWYKRNEVLYFLLFKYFSNEIVHPKLLKKSKKYTLKQHLIL